MKPQQTQPTALAASHNTFNELVHENRQLREQLDAEQEKVPQVVNNP